MADHIDTPQGRRIAWVPTEGAGPTVIFCGGFKSDMDGTKARHLEDWARAAGRGFVRFDYSGHGISEGAFEDGAIGDWTEDAQAVLDRVNGRVVLVGSSMGGWIALLLARAAPERIAGIVTVAAAPDFTEDGIWASLSDRQRAELAQTGQVALPSDYGAPYVITQRLIDDGRRHLVLRDPLNLALPVRLLQGTADNDVDVSVALRLLDHAQGPDIRLTLVKGADHRFSTPDCLDMIVDAVEAVTRRAG